jgi:hypothetical protein
MRKTLPAEELGKAERVPLEIFSLSVSQKTCFEITPSAGGYKRSALKAQEFGCDDLTIVTAIFTCRHRQEPTEQRRFGGAGYPRSAGSPFLYSTNKKREENDHEKLDRIKKYGLVERQERLVAPLVNILKK